MKIYMNIQINIFDDQLYFWIDDNFNQHLYENLNILMNIKMYIMMNN